MCACAESEQHKEHRRAMLYSVLALVANSGEGLSLFPPQTFQANH